MKRRELLLVLTGAMTAPRALRAQQKAMPVSAISAARRPARIWPCTARR
jgi:hypothetical protein